MTDDEQNSESLTARAKEIAFHLYAVACDDANGNEGVLSYSFVDHVIKALLGFAEEVRGYGEIHHLNTETGELTKGYAKDDTAEESVKE